MVYSSITPKALMVILVLPFFVSISKAENKPQEHEAIDCSIAELDKDCLQDGATIIITSRKTPFAGIKPTTQSHSMIELSKRIDTPSTTTALVEGLPGVAENSQPGLYQVISIRGVSRQRILTLVDNVRLSSERRAGVAASFIDPLLLDSVSVTRGPVSTYYGSGAIGGVTQMGLKKEDGLTASAGYKALGDENFQLFRWGNESTTAAVVRRQANNSQDINGDELNTHFEQSAGYIQKSWQINDKQFNSWYFTSYGEDIGRSNSRYPDRIVNIPKERHQIFKTSLTSQKKWSLDFYLHDQSIITSTLRPETSLSEVTSESTDFGINWQTAWEQENQSSLLGIDLYSRKNVNTRETFFDLQNSQTIERHTLNNGQRDELAAFYTFNKQFSDFRFQIGGRYTFENESEADHEGKGSNKAFTAFMGLAFDLSEQWEINFNVGNAFRFASLTEMYFSGTTARGVVLGNPELKAEQAISYDLGFRWHYNHHRLSATYFISDFNDYIERIEVSENLLTFVNLEEGQIKGLEAEYDWQISNNIDLRVIATFIEGVNSQGQTLADIPSNRISLINNYFGDNWSSYIKYQHRFNKTEFGNGELPTESANILSAGFSYQLNEQFKLSLYADNLLDESYVSSADDLSTLSPGRNFGINITWQSH